MKYMPRSSWINVGVNYVSGRLISSGRYRFVFFLLLLIFSGQTISAQTGKVTVSLTNTSIEVVLDELRSQADINFVYNHEELAKCPLISIKVKNIKVETVLEQCLEAAGLTFKQLNNTYIITPSEKSESMRILKAEPLKGILNGLIIDRDSRAPLPSANVVVLNTDPRRGSITDENGQFSIDNLPVGRHEVMISFVGYKEIILPEIFVGSSREAFITVAISEKTEEIDEVSVSIAKGEPLNQMATVSSRSFSVEETRRYAASISDPARMAQVFAGVSGNDDATNEMVIRGNSPNWVQWRLEGVVIPSPNHFSEEGYTSGAVSILSSDLLTTSDFYTGAFPAEFGNALSGIFDLRLRNGNSKKHEFSAMAGVLGIDFSAEGPFRKGYNGSYLINYRYSTFSLMNNLNLQVSKNTLPNYQDLSFKINLPTEKFGTFSLWGLGGISDDNEKYIPAIEEGEDPRSGYIDFTKSGMYATGLTHTFFPDNKSYIRTVFSLSDNYSGEDFLTMDSLGLLRLRLDDELQNRAYRVTTTYNRKLTHHLTLRTGVTLNNLNFSYISTIGGGDGESRTFLRGNGSTNLFQGYLQSKYKFSENILVTAGLHYAYFGLSQDHSLEPRLGLMINLSDRQRLSFGYGRHSKHENLPVYFVEVIDSAGHATYPNIGLDLTRASHYVMGYDKMFGNDFQMKAEIYYQRIKNLPTPNNVDKLLPPLLTGVPPDDTLENIGGARNYGIELTLQKYFTNSYYVLVTTSLFNAKFQPANGNWYNSRYSLKRVANFVAGKEFAWGRNKMIGVNTKIIWTGGKRIFLIDLPASIQAGQSVYKFDELYENQAPDYFRIDLGINLHLFGRKAEHIISLDVQNLTNRKNIWAEEYDPYTESISYYTLTGIIPLLNYRIEF